MQNYDDRWSGQTLNTGQHARLTSVQGKTMMIGEVAKRWTQGKAVMIGKVAKHWTQYNMQDWQMYRAELWW